MIKVFIVSAALIFLAASCNTTQNATAYNDGTIVLANKTINVDLAQTGSEKSRGLSGRSQIGENEGMLFDFSPTYTKPVFWMKDMNFDIDIVWIRDNEVVEISKNVPAQPGASDAELKLFLPATDVNFVLELQGGWADKFGLKPGDRIETSLR